MHTTTMSRRFHWPWQLAAHPSVVIDALLDLRLQEIQLDSVVTKPTIFDVLFFTTLKLIGYDRAPTFGPNAYQHVWDKNIQASVVLASVVRRGTTSFTCCSGSNGKFSTTFILDLDTTQDILCSKELIGHWVNLIVQRVLLHLPMPRPRRGCLLICGEDFDRESAKAFFRYDLMILQSQENKLKNDRSFISSQLNDVKEKSDRDGIDTFVLASTASKGELIEYVIVENESKEVTMSIIELFFSIGYISPMCIFNGHGIAETGELVVRAGKRQHRSKKTDSYDTISFPEISRTVSKLYENYSIASGGLAEALFVLNSCYSHLFQSGGSIGDVLPLTETDSGTNFPGATAPAHSSRLQVISLTTEAIPTAPAGGCIKYFRRHPTLLPVQYHDLLGGLVLSDIALPGMNMFITQFSRSVCAFRAPPQFSGEHTAKSGVYVFRCGQDGTGLVRVIYDHHVRHAIVVDGGTDAKLFYQAVWKEFMLRHASTYDVVLTSSDGRCTSGIYALFNSKSFMRENTTTTQPRCVRLFTKGSSPAKDAAQVRSHCSSDLEIIVSRALAAGVEVINGVAKGDVVYSQRHRSLHAQYGVRIEVIAPVAVSAPSLSGSCRSAPVSAPCSPMRRDVGPRVKEQLGMSADMSEFDISLISSLVSMYTMSVDAPVVASSPVRPQAAVHPAALRDDAPAQLSVRAWTKIFQVNEPGILQCTIKRSKKKALPVQSVADADTPWVECLQFPSDNV